MAESDKKEVFISYSTRNGDLAQLFCNQLEGAGVPCWIAPRDIPSGGKWAGAITDGISNSKVFALLVSEASTNSGEVEKEIDLANSNKNITIIPVRIEDVTLQGAFQYHLSNKQWVNALSDDKFTRFMDAVNAICKVLGKEGIDSAVAGGSVIALARQLANELNSKFRDKLGIINSMFSARKISEQVVQLFFPLRIGAAGVDLIIQFDADKSEMRIYADAASDGDILKDPFYNLLNGKFKKLLPKLKKKSGARRWEFVELVPCENLASPLAELEPANRFGLFKANVLEFTDKVMPTILDWAVYAVKVGEAIDELESRLKTIFPANEWKVGAPERKRLKGFLDLGAIYVYKEKWRREGADRGILSLAIESSRFLGGIYVGIVKQNQWLNLGDEWEDKLKNETGDVLGKQSQPGDEFLRFCYLEEEWKRSGISEAEALWDDTKLKKFVEHCVGEFEKMKKLENMLDEACAALPDLQIKPSNEFPQEKLKSWVGNEFYIENRLREIAERLQAAYNGSGLSASYRFLGGGNWNDVFLTARCGKFDATVAFRVYSRQWLTAIMNLDPPDFETPTIKSYFARFHKNINFEEKRAFATSDLDGGTLPEWMDEYEKFVIERAAAIAPALVDLKQHLDKVVCLAKSVEMAIKASDDGWFIRNEAIDLERSASLAFWHKNWIAPESKGDDFPPVVIRIVPEELCFEDLKLVLTSTSGAMAGLDRIAGACDFAFGQGGPPSNGFWSKQFDEEYRYTGGSRFDKTLIDGSEGSDFIKHVREIAEKFKQMEPIIGAICREQNDKDYADFCVKYEMFIKSMTVAIKQDFPEQDGWQVVARAPVAVKNAYIVVFKNAWQREGEARGLLSFVVEGNMRFDGLWFGIVKSSNKIDLPDEKLGLLKQEMAKLFKEGENTEVNWYPYWRFAEEGFRYTGAANRKLASKDKLDKICNYYANVFQKMKEATPKIDDIVTELKSKPEVKPE